MAGPKFLQRLSRIPEVINLLSAYPDGLSLRRLADQFGVDEQTMREDLVTYLDLESWGWSFDIFRKPALEFVQPDGDDDGPEDSAARTVVRIVPDATPGIGAEHLSAGDLATIYTAASALLEVDPHDEDLAAARAVIAETMYGEPAAAPYVGGWSHHVRDLQDAQETERKVRIVYSRAWLPGVTDRVIEPLRLVQTRRGWEVDAGPVGPEGNLRTFLVSNIRLVEVLDDGFEPPADALTLLAKQRATTTVRMELAQDARWAARQHAERVVVVSEDENTFIADLELLAPVGERVGLILLASGPSSRVVSPGSVLPEALGLVQELLDHHEAAGRPTA
jgi:proteasome accessory factor C